MGRAVGREGSYCSAMGFVPGLSSNIKWGSPSQRIARCSRSPKISMCSESLLQDEQESIESKKQSPVGSDDNKDGMRDVSIKRPMGIAFEETNRGLVYVAEVFEGSNAEGLVNPGDEVLAVSIPYGDAMSKMEGGGVQEFQSFLLERDEKEEFINLRVRPFEGGLEELSKRAAEVGELNLEQSLDLKQKIAQLPYPELMSDEPELEVELPPADEDLLQKLSKMSLEEKLEWYKSQQKQ